MKGLLLGLVALASSFETEAQGRMPPVDFAPDPMNHEFSVGFQCAQQFGISMAAAGCVATLLTIDEINKCFTDGIGGKGCFGDNNTMVAMVRDNIIAAQRENKGPDQVIRATTGVSMKDIRDRGILGGDGSEARKECRRLPKWGFKC